MEWNPFKLYRTFATFRTASVRNWVGLWRPNSTGTSDFATPNAKPPYLPQTSTFTTCNLESGTNKIRWYVPVQSVLVTGVQVVLFFLTSGNVLHNIARHCRVLRWIGETSPWTHEASVVGRTLTQRVVTRHFDRFYNKIGKIFMIKNG